MVSQLPTLFISYRRSDGGKDASRIYDRLISAFGKYRVFKDIDNIPIGADFRDVILDAVRNCDVLLVLIGREWLTISDEAGNRRLDNPDDFVRLEIETGLQYKQCLVIPIVVDNAKIPKAEHLPVSLRQLAFKQAVVVRDDPDFHRDVDRLINGIMEQFNSSNMSKTLSSPAEINSERSNNVHPANSVQQMSQEKDGISTSLLSIKHVDGKQQLAHDILLDDANGGQIEKNAVFSVPLKLEWVHIPYGKTVLEDVSDRGGTAEQQLTVAAFAIAKYPVTNAQYQVFVEAEDGYCEPRWWYFSESSRKWRANHPMASIPDFVSTDIPRTDVSWYDALAFCRWLSSTTGQTIELPTEQQWQWAAQGNDNRVFPWGNHFDASCCNFDSDAPTSVAQFPNGASPFGVWDMSGNVWEWCLNTWKTHETTLSASDAHVLRGGAWNISNSSEMRITYRNWFRTTGLNSTVGFRCVCVANCSYGTCQITDG